MREKAPDRARELDAKLDADLRAIRLPCFKAVLTGIRKYLLDQDSEVDRRNNVLKILKEFRDGSVGLIMLGPEIDKGPTPDHYYLRSGDRLSFGITLKEESRQCSLVTYRFHLQAKSTKPLTFYRFDLNNSSHQRPLFEPRSHLHVGSDNVRLPTLVMSPFDILDRIFHVIQKSKS